LVLLHVGAQKEKPNVTRINPDGKLLPGDSRENKHEKGVPIVGRYYE